MRKHRLSYNSPSGDVASGVVVCIVAMPAFHTPKLRLGFTVALVDTATEETLFAGIMWIDNHHRHTGPLGLILDKVAKLAEAPVMQAFPLRFVGLNPCPDVLEIFKPNAERGAFRSGDDAFGNTVVLVFLEPLLSAAYLPKAAPSGPCTYALQGGASFGVAFPIGFDFSPAVPLTQAVSGDIYNPKIHTKDALMGKQFGIVKVAHRGQIPLATYPHQIDFAFAMFEQFELVIAANIANLFSTRQKPQRDFLIRDKAQDAIVVRLRRVLAEGAFSFLIQFVGVRHFGNAAYRHLRRQLKLSAEFLVGKFVQIVLAKCLGFPCILRKPVTCPVATLKR